MEIIGAEELRALKQSRWEEMLRLVLREAARSDESLETSAKGAVWKCEVAERLRGVGASYAWIAENLHMGNPVSVRSLLCRRRRNQQTTA